MKPKIVITIEPVSDSDYAQVRVNVSGTADNGREYAVVLYDQLRLAQGLADSMLVEPWLLASISEHTDAIKYALSGMIHRGIQTLMVNTNEVQRT